MSVVLSPEKMAVFVCLLFLSGCNDNGDPPSRGNYSLSWYRYEGAHYGPLIPGFKTLEMCRRAGVGMTLERLIEQHGIQPNLDYSDKTPHPWFECGTDCKPYYSGTYLLSCNKIAEFHGGNAEKPR